MAPEVVLVSQQKEESRKNGRETRGKRAKERKAIGISRKDKDIDVAPYDHKADYWSFGLILYVSLVGQEELSELGPDLLPEAITVLRKLHIEIEQRVAQLSPDRFSIALLDFLTQLLRVNKEKRIDFEQIEGHPFLTTDNLTVETSTGKLSKNKRN